MQKMMLESFEKDASHVNGPNPDFEAGFAEGHAAGLAAAKEEQTALARELTQNIADLKFKYDEARGEMTRALGPFFATIVDKVFPKCLSDGFAEQIVLTLEQAAAQAATSGLKLRLNPSQCDAVAAALSTTSINAELLADPALSSHAAWIEYGHQALHVDYDALIGEIRDIITSVNFIETRNAIHGESHGPS